MKKTQDKKPAKKPAAKKAGPKAAPSGPTKSRKPSPEVAARRKQEAADRKAAAKAKQQERNAAKHEREKERAQAAKAKQQERTAKQKAVAAKKAAEERQRELMAARPPSSPVAFEEGDPLAGQRLYLRECIRDQGGKNHCGMEPMVAVAAATPAAGKRASQVWVVREGQQYIAPAHEVRREVNASRRFRSEHEGLSEENVRCGDYASSQAAGFPISPAAYDECPALADAPGASGDASFPTSNNDRGMVRAPPSWTPSAVAPSGPYYGATRTFWAMPNTLSVRSPDLLRARVSDFRLGDHAVQLVTFPAPVLDAVAQRNRLHPYWRFPADAVNATRAMQRDFGLGHDLAGAADQVYARTGVYPLGQYQPTDPAILDVVEGGTRSTHANGARPDASGFMWRPGAGGPVARSNGAARAPVIESGADVLVMAVHGIPDAIEFEYRHALGRKGVVEGGETKSARTYSSGPYSYRKVRMRDGDLVWVADVALNPLASMGRTHRMSVDVLSDRIEDHLAAGGRVAWLNGRPSFSELPRHGTLQNHHGHAEEHAAGDPLGVYMPPLAEWSSQRKGGMSRSWTHPALGWTFWVWTPRAGYSATRVVGGIHFNNHLGSRSLGAGDTEAAVYDQLRRWYATQSPGDGSRPQRYVATMPNHHGRAEEHAPHDMLGQYMPPVEQWETRVVPDAVGDVRESFWVHPQLRWRFSILWFVPERGVEREGLSGAAVQFGRGALWPRDAADVARGDASDVPPGYFEKVGQWAEEARGLAGGYDALRRWYAGIRREDLVPAPRIPGGTRANDGRVLPSGLAPMPPLEEWVINPVASSWRRGTAQRSEWEDGGGMLPHLVYQIDVRPVAGIPAGTEYVGTVEVFENDDTPLQRVFRGPTRERVWRAMSEWHHALPPYRAPRYVGERYDTRENKPPAGLPPGTPYFDAAARGDLLIGQRVSGDNFAGVIASRASDCEGDDGYVVGGHPVSRSRALGALRRQQVAAGETPAPSRPRRPRAPAPAAPVIDVVAEPAARTFAAQEVFVTPVAEPMRDDVMLAPTTTPPRYGVGDCVLSRVGPARVWEIGDHDVNGWPYMLVPLSDEREEARFTEWEGNLRPSDVCSQPDVPVTGTVITSDLPPHRSMEVDASGLVGGWATVRDGDTVEFHPNRGFSTRYSGALEPFRGIATNVLRHSREPWNIEHVTLRMEGLSHLQDGQWQQAQQWSHVEIDDQMGDLQVIAPEAYRAPPPTDLLASPSPSYVPTAADGVHVFVDADGAVLVISPGLDASVSMVAAATAAGIDPSAVFMDTITLTDAQAQASSIRGAVRGSGLYAPGGVVDMTGLRYLIQELESHGMIVNVYRTDGGGDGGDGGGSFAPVEMAPADSFGSFASEGGFGGGSVAGLLPEPAPEPPAPAPAPMTPTDRRRAALDRELQATRTYGLNSRPAGAGNLPRGWAEHTGSAASLFRYGAVRYDAPLPLEEIARYELTPVWTTPLDAYRAIEAASPRLDRVVEQARVDIRNGADAAKESRFVAQSIAASAEAAHREFGVGLMGGLSPEEILQSVRQVKAIPFVFDVPTVPFDPSRVTPYQMASARWLMSADRGEGVAPGGSGNLYLRPDGEVIFERRGAAWSMEPNGNFVRINPSSQGLDGAWSMATFKPANEPGTVRIDVAIVDDGSDFEPEAARFGRGDCVESPTSGRGRIEDVAAWRPGVGWSYRLQGSEKAFPEYGMQPAEGCPPAVYGADAASVFARTLTYGLRSRPAGYGTVPEGWDRTGPAPEGLGDLFPYGVVTYPAPLRPDALDRYELTPVWASKADALDAALATQKSPTPRDRWIEDVRQYAPAERSKLAGYARDVARDLYEGEFYRLPAFGQYGRDEMADEVLRAAGLDAAPVRSPAPAPAPPVRHAPPKHRVGDEVYVRAMQSSHVVEEVTPSPPYLYRLQGVVTQLFPESALEANSLGGGAVRIMRPPPKAEGHEAAFKAAVREKTEAEFAKLPYRVGDRVEILRVNPTTGKPIRESIAGRHGIVEGITAIHSSINDEIRSISVYLGQVAVRTDAGATVRLEHVDVVPETTPAPAVVPDPIVGPPAADPARPASPTAVLRDARDKHRELREEEARVESLKARGKKVTKPGEAARLRAVIAELARVWRSWSEAHPAEAARFVLDAAEVPERGARVIPDVTLVGTKYQGAPGTVTHRLKPEGLPLSPWTLEYVIQVDGKKDAVVATHQHIKPAPTSATPMTVQSPSEVGGRIAVSVARAGSQMVVKFSGRPPIALRGKLRTAGYDWKGEATGWVAPVTEASVAMGKSLDPNFR